MDNIYVDDDGLPEGDVDAFAHPQQGYIHDEDDPMDDGMDAHNEAGEAITAEDAWTVISANFQEKGLVRQQLDSFDMFMSNTMQVSFSFFLLLH